MCRYAIISLEWQETTFPLSSFQVVLALALLLQRQLDDFRFPQSHKKKAQRGTKREFIHSLSLS